MRELEITLVLLMLTPFIIAGVGLINKRFIKH